MIVILDDVAMVRTGLVLARKKAQTNFKHSITYEQVGLRCFSSTVKLDRHHTDKFNATEKIDDKYLTIEGDVLVRLRSPASALYIDKVNEGLLISSLMLVIRVNKNILDAKYLAYFINAQATQHILRQDIKGTAIPMLKTKDLKQLKITLPTLEKQKKLVKFLELADKERASLLSLAHEKKILSQTILDIIIQQNKEEN